MAPYSPPSLPRGARVRGNIRQKLTNKDLVVTMPKMRVVYSGCRWNSVVFAMTPEQKELISWLNCLYKFVEDTVRADPGVYKVRPQAVPLFTATPVQPSNNPDLYPPELRCRLATEGRSDEAVCVAALGDVDPSEVRGGGFMTPVVKVGYFKDQDTFGLTFTILKAEYEAPVVERISNDDWQMDVE